MTSKKEGMFKKLKDKIQEQSQELSTSIRESGSNFLDNLMSDLPSKFHDYEVRSGQHSQKIAQLEEDISEMAESIKLYKEKMASATSHCEILNDKLKAAELEKQLLQDDINRLKIDLHSRDDDLVNRDLVIAELKSKISELANSNQKIVHHQEAIDKDRNKITASVSQLESLVAAKESELVQKQDVIHNLENDLVAKNSEIAEKEQEIIRLNIEIESLKCNNQELKELVELEKKNIQDEKKNLRQQISDLKLKIDQLEVAKEREQIDKPKESHDPISNSVKQKDQEDEDGWGSSEAMDPLELVLKEKEALIDNLNDKITSLELAVRNKEAELESMFNRGDQSVEDKLIYDYKKEINYLETELDEKSSALEQLHQHYQKIIKEKADELQAMHNEFNSSSVNEHSYQVKAMQRSLLQYQEENLRLKELLDIRSREESSRGHPSLMEATEFEYLRNIMFEYMMGREPSVS